MLQNGRGLASLGQGVTEELLALIACFETLRQPFRDQYAGECSDGDCNPDSENGRSLPD